MSEVMIREEQAPPAETLMDRFEIEARALMLIENRDQQPEVVVPRQEYQDNARTALMEALTASGHLSKVELSGESIEEINQQVLNRLLNGWDDNLPAHEKKRRFAEICEELVIQDVHRGILEGVFSTDTAVGIISDCPVVEMPGIGYRYSNRKGMVRSTHLRQNTDGSYTRIIEQISRSNSGPETTFSFLGSCNTDLSGHETTDLAALNTPILYTKQNFIDGVVSMQRQLDYFAGPNIRYGDSINAKPEHAAYEKLREESARRETEIECYIDGLADLEAYLDIETKAQRLSITESTNIFKEEVSRILNAICTIAPEYAEATFGKAAAPAFYQASDLIMRGFLEEATQILSNNEYLKQTVTFCGMTISIEEAQGMGLPVNEFGKLVEKGKENWPYKPGVCVVEVCPTRPGKTDVGPCSVCKTCQSLFDSGRDPTKFINLRKHFAGKKAGQEDAKKERDQKKKQDSTIETA